MTHCSRLSAPSFTRRGIFALLILAFAVDGFAQTVADIARRERTRQKGAQSKVVVSSVGTTTTTGAGGSVPTATTGADKKPTGPTDNAGREKFWRAAFQKARDDAKRADARVEVLDLRIKDLNTQLLRQSDVYNREYRIGAEITTTQKELDDARKEAEMAKKKISDLEEALRRSGGPAGWAR